MASYGGGSMSKAHIDFLKGGHLWLELENRLFVHGGFDPEIPMAKQGAQFLMWDRELLGLAWKLSRMGRQKDFGGYEDVFVGHTTTETYRSIEPIHVCNVWDLDTGAGWSGKLTIMNVSTKEYWQSDFSSDLYGGMPNQLT